MLSKKSFLIAASLVLVAAFGIVVSADDKKSESAVKLPTMTPAMNLGKMVFDAKCAACHGENGVGTDQGPPFLHRVYHPGHHGDGAFFLVAKKGVRAHHWKFGDMPPVAGVNDRQIEKIILYIRALQKANGVF